MASIYPNIRTINSESVTGYQVNISAFGECYQPYFPGLNNKSLRSALKARNKLYKKLNIGPRYAILQKLPLPVKGADTNTGIYGIAERVRTERNGSEYVAYVCRMRNLITGRASNKEIRLYLYRSKKKARNAAIALVNANAEAYNKVVDRYNKMALRELFKVAEAEAVSLKPRLYKLNERSQKRWDEAFKKVFPRGLNDPIDVRNG